MSQTVGYNCWESQSPTIFFIHFASINSSFPPTTELRHQPQLSQIHSLQFKMVLSIFSPPKKEKIKAFKAQDSRCTVKVGSMQLKQTNFALGELGAPNHQGVLQNPDSEGAQVNLHSGFRSFFFVCVLFSLLFKA